MVASLLLRIVSTKRFYSYCRTFNFQIPSCQLTWSYLTLSLHPPKKRIRKLLKPLRLPTCHLQNMKVTHPPRALCWTYLALLMTRQASDTPQSEAESGERLFSGSSLSIVQALAILGSWFSSFPGISKQLSVSCCTYFILSCSHKITACQ